MALSWTMDKLGPLARTAEDCGLVLEAIAGPDPLDPTTLPHSLRGSAARLSPGSFRLGILRGTREKTQPEVLANFEPRSVLLREEWPTLPKIWCSPISPSTQAAGLIIDAEAASAFESLFESGRITELTAPEDRLGGYPGQVILAKDYLRALRVRRLRRRLDRC